MPTCTLFWGKKNHGSGCFSGSCADDHQLTLDGLMLNLYFTENVHFCSYNRSSFGSVEGRPNLKLKGRGESVETNLIINLIYN